MNKLNEPNHEYTCCNCGEKTYSKHDAYKHNCPPTNKALKLNNEIRRQMNDYCLAQEAYQLAILGQCPDCRQKVKDWKAPSGSFAPEAWATLREHNIDPSTGHKSSCTLKAGGNKND